MDELFGLAKAEDFDMDKFLRGGYRGIYGGGSHVFATKQKICESYDACFAEVEKNE